MQTAQNYITVSPSFAATIKVGEPIYYKLSTLFNEINGYRLSEDQPFKVHSMRWFTGLILPLLAMAILLISLRYPDKYGTFLFVVQCVLIADLIYLLN